MVTDNQPTHLPTIVALFACSHHLLPLQLCAALFSLGAPCSASRVMSGVDARKRHGVCVTEMAIVLMYSPLEMRVALRKKG